MKAEINPDLIWKFLHSTGTDPLTHSSIATFEKKVATLTVKKWLSGTLVIASFLGVSILTFGTPFSENYRSSEWFSTLIGVGLIAGVIGLVWNIQLFESLETDFMESTHELEILLGEEEIAYWTTVEVQKVANEKLLGYAQVARPLEMKRTRSEPEEAAMDIAHNAFNELHSAVRQAFGPSILATKKHYYDLANRSFGLDYQI